MSRATFPSHYFPLCCISLRSSNYNLQPPQSLLKTVAHTLDTLENDFYHLLCYTVYTCVCLCVHMHVCVYLCVCMYTYVCMHVQGVYTATVQLVFSRYLNSANVCFSVLFSQMVFPNGIWRYCVFFIRGLKFHESINIREIKYLIKPTI